MRIKIETTRPKHLTPDCDWSNQTKINAVLDTVQSKAKERKVYAWHVYKAIEKIESRLSDLLPKKDWTGLIFSVDPNAQKLPSSYKHAAYSTQFTIERRSSSWYLIGVSRAYLNRHQWTISPVNLRDKSESILPFVCRPF